MRVMSEMEAIQHSYLKEVPTFTIEREQELKQYSACTLMI